MDFNCNDEDDAQEINKLNIVVVYNALALLENSATEREMSDVIINHSGQPDDLVIQEVRRVLRIGVDNGFLVKIGDQYTLLSLRDIYDLDGDDDACEMGSDASDDADNLEEDSCGVEQNLEEDSDACDVDEDDAAPACPKADSPACATAYVTPSPLTGSPACATAPAGSPVRFNVTVTNPTKDGVAISMDVMMPSAKANQECADNEDRCDEKCA